MNVARHAQLEAILSHSFVGLDQYMGGPGKPRAPRFDDIFTVSEEDVLDYVQRHGWDSRVVHELVALPGDPEQVSWDWRFFVLPPAGGQWTCGRRVDTERRSSPYELWHFASREEMERFMVHDLFEAQRHFWSPGTVLEVPTYGSAPGRSVGSRLMQFLRGKR